MKVPNRLEKYKYHLAVLNDKKFRKGIITHAPNDFIHTLSEICKNSLHGNIPHTSEEKKCLKKHKAAIKTIIRKSTPVKRKRQILIQSGGFIGFLLGPVIKNLLQGAGII